MSLLTQLKGIKQNVKLALYTTFKIGGPARFFYPARSTDDIIKAVRVAKKLKIAYFILGGGSNLLVSDKGFDGLVIKTKDSRLKIKDSAIVASPGVSLARLVAASVSAELTGLEWATGIPGTVGGAVRGNASAFGGVMADLVKKVSYLPEPFTRVKKLEKKQSQFAYRDSIFKHRPAIILEVELELKKGKKAQNQKKIGSFLSQRKRSQPIDASAGCIFKNPQIANLPEFEHKFHEYVPAGYLIDKCGLKGKKTGQAQISQKHANFIINLGGAKAEDVIGLIKLIKKEVRNKFEVELEEEIEYLGF